MAYILAVWNKNLRTCYTQTGGGITSPLQSCTQNSEYIAFLEALTTSGGWVFNNVTLDSPTGMVTTLGKDSSGSGTPLPTGAATFSEQYNQTQFLNTISGHTSSLLSDSSNIATNTNDTKNEVIATRNATVPLLQTIAAAKSVIYTPVIIDGQSCFREDLIATDGSFVSSTYFDFDGNIISPTGLSNIIDTNGNKWRVLEIQGQNYLASKGDKCEIVENQLFGNYTSVLIYIQTDKLETANFELRGIDMADSQQRLVYEESVQKDYESANIIRVTLRADINGFKSVYLQMMDDKTSSGYEKITFVANIGSNTIVPNLVGSETAPILGFKDLYDTHTFIGTKAFTTQELLFNIHNLLGHDQKQTLGALARASSQTLADLKNLDSDTFVTSAVGNTVGQNLLLATAGLDWLDTMQNANFRSFALTIIGGASGSIQVLLEGTNEATATVGVAIPFFNDATLTENNTGNQTIAALTRYHFSAPIRYRYIRCRIMVVSAGSATALVRYSKGDFYAPTQRVTPVQATPANLQMTPVQATPANLQMTANQTNAANCQVTATQGAASASALWLIRPRGANTGGLTMFKLVSAASANQTLVKNGATTLYKLVAQSTSNCYLKLFNLTTAPTLGTSVPVATYYLPANQTVTVVTDIGDAFSTGLSLAITLNGNDLDGTGIPANAAFVNLSYV